MPYKHSEERRHKFEKSRYKVTNWPEYNAALKRRGDFTMWFTDEAIAEWCPAKTGARGRPMKYSNIAIETALFMRQVFHLALRQTESFMNSLARALKVEISIPDFSCISKRSTGCTWRKLHLAIDEHHQVLACELTTPEVGDTTVVPELLGQITTPFETFMGDGADDGNPVAQAVLAKQANAQVVTPPHKTAVLSAVGNTLRDLHIETIAQKGRVARQRITGYHFRSYVELAMQRYKRIFGNTMKVRALARQKTEGWISASALNRMTSLGMPVSVKI